MSKRLQRNDQRNPVTRFLVVVGIIILTPLRMLARAFGFGRGTREEELEEQGVPEESLRRGHETRDVPVRPLLVAGIVLAVIAAILHVALWGLHELFADLTATSPVTPLRGTPIVPPAPRLQADPAAEMQEFLRVEEEILTSYGWIDRDQGIVRIPIELAMEILAERGLPVRDDAPGLPGLGFYEAHELDSEGGQEFELVGTPQPLGEITSPFVISPFEEPEIVEDEEAPGEEEQTEPTATPAP